MQNTARRPKITVSDDGSGIVSQAGALPVTETARITGLGAELSAGLARWRPSRAVHDPGKTVLDLAVAVALGGDCLADVGVLRAEPALFGPVASDPVVSRLVTRLAAESPAALKAIRAARAAARQRAWTLAGSQAPGTGGGQIVMDIDATIVTSCSDKEQAAPTWKKTYGFHPLTVFADHGSDGSGEPLTIMLRPGNAGSSTASDHITSAKLALAQLPVQARRRVLVRADSGGGTHDFLTWLTAPRRRLAYSVGFTITGEARQAIMMIPARAWTPAYDGDGQVRDGAWVAGLTGMLDLAGWPKGMRVIVRKERPHPGAQLRFTDTGAVGLIAQIVPPDRLQKANSLLSVSNSGASVAGPALSGLLVAAAGTGWGVGGRRRVLCGQRGVPAGHAGAWPGARGTAAVPRRACRRVARGDLAQLGVVDADRQRVLQHGLRRLPGSRAGCALQRLGGASGWGFVSRA